MGNKQPQTDNAFISGLKMPAYNVASDYLETTFKQIEESINIKEIGQLSSIFPMDRGLETKNFRLTIDNADYVLKIYRANLTNEVVFEEGLLNKLSSQYDNFPKLVTSMFYLGDRPCLLYKYIYGVMYSKSHANEKFLSCLAKLIANLHLSLFKFVPSGERQRFSIFDYSFTETFSSVLSPEESKIITQVKNLISLGLEKYRFTELPKTIIHEDLEAVNTIIDVSGNCFIIDFGEAHYAEMISDLASGVKELIINIVGLDFSLIRGFLETYMRHNPMVTKNQLKLVYLLILRRTLFMYTYLLHRRDVSVAGSDFSSLTETIDLERKVLKMLLLISEDDFNKSLGI